MFGEGLECPSEETLQVKRKRKEDYKERHKQLQGRGKEGKNESKELKWIIPIHLDKRKSSLD